MARSSLRNLLNGGEKPFALLVSHETPAHAAFDPLIQNRKASCLECLEITPHCPAMSRIIRWKPGHDLLEGDAARGFQQP